MLKNLMHNANSKNPNIIFTEFSHPPDLGRFSSQPGKIAKRENQLTPYPPPGSDSIVTSRL